MASGSIVGRVTERMEYGPMALGDRSILALPTDRKIEDILNQRLRRDEFMPFGSSVLEEYAVNEYFVNGKKSPFMVETFTVNDKYLDTFPSVVHVDNTVRPQTVSHEHNPGYYGTIRGK